MSWGKSGKDLSTLSVKGYIGSLVMALEDALGSSWASLLGVKMPSNQETETYKFLGQFPVMREWIGNRQAKGLPPYEYTLRNKLYEATIEVDKNDFKFDKSGQIQMKMADAGRRAAQHWESLITTLIETLSTGYDGVNFFATTHTLGGDSGTMKNDLAAAEVPALDVTTAASPTKDEMVEAILGVIAHLYTYKDNAGEPANGDAKQFAVMVPTNLMKSAKAAERELLNASGGENTARSQDFGFTTIVNPRLTSTTKFYVFRTDAAFKPFLLQDVDGPQIDFLGEGSEVAFLQHKYLFGIEATRSAGYGQWMHAARATLS
jgi:phage major head subunit gpT-like protein